ncbi:hypothetical protein Ccrd_010588 [Cynara cardunculus var. scolymus]|uniref:TRF2/HOY1 PH-like domain-containing protein n=1 Tax=Cynara cardunculus var. scolymus TaxID=59895 RepID=A0A103YKV8_CYNCS|nr:hypothetical protein Ccrd_010588 [Cynara cardunculus var. scolymus]
MAAGGERNRNHWSNDDEHEQHQGRSLNNASGSIHGDSSRHHHAGYDDLPTRYDNGVGFVYAFGDLVAKLYYGKKKLVWEFLFGSLKRKMEISWGDISAINTFINEGENGRLEIELNVPPQFGQEINSQPGKHTQWTTMTDFTGDHALICRRHKVEFLPGVLDKHLEKLLQCDSRLLRLSRQPFPIHNSPYFPNTYINFSNSESVVGCSSIPIANGHQQEFFSPVGHLDPPTGPFVGHSSSNLSLVSNMSRISRQKQKTGGVREQRGNFQIQDTSSIPIREQDHFLPYHGIESIIFHPQLGLYVNDAQNLVDFPMEQQAKGNYDYTNSDYHLGYIDDEIALQEPSFWLPNQVSIDDSNKGNSVTNHMAYVDDETCSVYQPGINNGVVIHEPSSWLPAHVNSSYEDHHEVASNRAKDSLSFTSTILPPRSALAIGHEGNHHGQHKP